MRTPQNNYTAEAECSRLSSPGGFTLLELLVCVLIIGLLVTILLPALSMARQRGEAAKCLSNLRQLGAGSASYSGDNNGLLVPIAYSPLLDGTGSDPNTQVWRSLIAPYVGETANGKNTKNVFQCPSDRANYGVKLSGNGLSPSSYGINDYTRQPGFLTTQALHGYLNHPSTHVAASVPAGSHTIFICDIALVSNPSAPLSQWKDKGSTGSYGYARMPNDLGGGQDSGFYGTSDSWDIFPRHGGKFANAVFYDGHAESVDVQTQVLNCPPTSTNCIYDYK